MRQSNPSRTSGSRDELRRSEPAPEDPAALQEAKSIRWFFKALFVQNILEVVAGKEAEVWMVESGIRNRVHIYRVDREREDQDEEPEEGGDLFAEPTR